MKINSKKTSKKILVAIFLVFVLLAGLAAVYAFKKSSDDKNTSDTSQGTHSTDLNKPTEEQIQDGNSVKKDSVTKSDNDTDTSPSPSNNDKKNVEVIITAANQNGGILQIRSQISTVSNTGNCILTLSKAEETITKTASIQPLATTSTCKGFDISNSELSSGEWQATLVFENESLRGSASKLITIQ